MTLSRVVHILTQILLPTLTLSAQYALAAGRPEWSLIINLCAQPFWIYSAWKAFKSAGQIGLLITTTIFTFITAWGILNYWF